MRSSFLGVKSYFSAAEKWWKEQDESTRTAIFIGGIAAAVMITGGIVLHAAITGLATNAFLWWGLIGPKQKEFLTHHGRKIGTLGFIFSIAAVPFVGANVGLSLMFTSGIFDVWRRVVCPSIEEPESKNDNQGKVSSDDDTIDAEFIPNNQQKATT